VKGAIKGFFAIIAAVLYAGAATFILLDAQGTPDFSPNSFQMTLLDTGAGAIIAFITAQLGLAVAQQNGDGFPASVKNTMGSDQGLFFLLLDVAAFSFVGLWFVLLAMKPNLIAVAEGAASLKDAPAYIDAHATLFIGVVFAAVAAIAPSVRD